MGLRSGVDGLDALAWLEDERFCDGCGADVGHGEEHTGGCDGSDPDEQVSALLDELAEFAHEGRSERERVNAEAEADLARYAR